jgi:hypothetical protein
MMTMEKPPITDEQREYWRQKQRESRARKKAQKLDGPTQSVDTLICTLVAKSMTVTVERPTVHVEQDTIALMKTLLKLP